MSGDEQPRMLTEGQLDGTACVHCGGREGEMVPVEVGPRGQLFAHRDCWHGITERLDCEGAP